MEPGISRIASADPKATYLAHRAEIDAAVARVLASGSYIHGPELTAFEKEFAAWLGTPDSVGVANGTDALELALRALDIGAGDKVATVANTVSATVAAIVATGAEPVFVDIDPATMLLDVDELERVLAAPTYAAVRAIVPVHLYGQMCDMPRVMGIARRHGARVVEDCAQAHGATCVEKKAGTWGDLAAFSFYPTKNLAALGDGGAVSGNDVAALQRVRSLRQYGWRTRYVSDEHGRNSRLDEIQAAILRVQLAHLDAGNTHRREFAQCYLDALADAPLRLPSVAPGREHVWHQFVVRTPQRGALKARLEAANIHCGVLYPVPLHSQAAYRQAISLPHTEQACAEVLSLPLHPGLTPADVRRVADAVRAALV